MAMCVHVLNAQVLIQCQACKGWYECAECHDADAAGLRNHNFKVADLVTFTCKACKIVFHKDMRTFDDVDSSCPNCLNCFVVAARTPEGEMRAHCMALLDKDMEELLKGF